MEMTEVEAMEKLVGRLARVIERTMTGTRTVLGRVTTPLLLTETTVEAVTVEGTVVAEHVTGLPLPLEPETPVRLELLPIATVELL